MLLIKGQNQFWVLTFNSKIHVQPPQSIPIIEGNKSGFAMLMFLLKCPTPSLGQGTGA
jgi:hypothetical protein